MTIIEAIKEAMKQHGSPMTAKHAYHAIVAEGLYEVHAQEPAHVVLQQIRRHCEGIDFPTAAPMKHFKLVGENRFWPLPRPKQSVVENTSRGLIDPSGTMGPDLSLLHSGHFRSCT